jgi:hypothetical protein
VIPVHSAMPNPIRRGAVVAAFLAGAILVTVAVVVYGGQEPKAQLSLAEKKAMLKAAAKQHTMQLQQACPPEYPYSQDAAPGYCYNNKCRDFDGAACRHPEGNPCDAWCGVDQSYVKWGPNCGRVCPEVDVGPGRTAFWEAVITADEAALKAEGDAYAKAAKDSFAAPASHAQASTSTLSDSYSASGQGLSNFLMGVANADYAASNEYEKIFKGGSPWLKGSPSKLKGSPSNEVSKASKLVAGPLSVTESLTGPILDAEARADQAYGRALIGQMNKYGFRGIGQSRVKAPGTSKLQWYPGQQNVHALGVVMRGDAVDAQAAAGTLNQIQAWNTGWVPENR